MCMSKSEQSKDLKTYCTGSAYLASPDKIVNIGMVYAECSETAAVLRAAPAIEQPDSAVSTSLPWIFRTRYIKS